MHDRMLEFLHQMYTRQAELSEHETKLLRLLERARWFPPGEGTIQLWHWQQHMESYL